MYFCQKSTNHTSVHSSCSVMSDSLQPHGLQHARLPCPSPTPKTHLISCQSSWWSHPIIVFPSSTFPSLCQYNGPDYCGFISLGIRYSNLANLFFLFKVVLLFYFAYISVWILEWSRLHLGFPGSSVVKNLSVMLTWVWSLGREDPLEKEMLPTSLFLLEKSQGQKSLADYSSRGCKTVWQGLSTKQQQTISTKMVKFL